MTSFDRDVREVEESTFTVDDAEATVETDKALLVKAKFFEGGQAWVPKSQIHEDSEVYEKDTEGKLVVTAWLAEQKGWV